MHGTTTDPNKLMDELAARANAAWRQSVESVIECGRILIEAKRKVGHGNWMKFVEKLDFTHRTAERLIEIAKHPVLSNPTHVSNLPRSWGTLHRLTYVEQSDLEALLKDGTVNCETERKDVDALIARFDKRGVYEYEDVVSALATLNKFMTKWPDLNDNLVGSIGNCLVDIPDYIDDGIYLDDLPKLFAWLSKLHHACNEDYQQTCRKQDRDAAESDWRPPKPKQKKAKSKSCG